MDSKDRTLDDPVRSSSPSPSDGWKERIIIPTLLAGVVGGGVGYRKDRGLASMSATYASNLAIVTGSYCGAREFVRATRDSEPDDLMNSALGGFASGALLGRLQAGQLGAIRYSIMFAVLGTTIDFAIPKTRAAVKSLAAEWYAQKDDWLRLPEWSPIQVLDEEALAAKKAREQQLLSQTRGNLKKHES